MHGHAFHVVNLVSEIGLDHWTAVDQRVCLQTLERHTANAHCDAAYQRVATFEQEEIAGGKDCTVGDVEVIGAPDAEACNAVAVEQERSQVAPGIKTAFADDNQYACKSRTRRRRHQALQAPVVSEGLEVGRNLDRLSAGA